MMNYDVVRNYDMHGYGIMTLLMFQVSIAKIQKLQYKYGNKIMAQVLVK